MADQNTPATPKRRAASKSTTGNPSAAKPRKTVAQKGAAKETAPMTDTAQASGASTTNSHRAEAKSRFNAALEEAKAGAAALKAEGRDRAVAYRDQARGKGKVYSSEARVKGKELAVEGKHKVSEGIAALGQMVGENAHVVDEKLGAKYGDYARSASRSLGETATRLDEKSVDELGEDAREFVRKSPGLAVGLAAVAGFMLSRLFTGSRR